MLTHMFILHTLPTSLHSIFAQIWLLSSHTHVFLQPSSSHSGVPPDDVALCSSILDSSFFMNEEQPIDRVGVAQPTCVLIHVEYE